MTQHTRPGVWRRISCIALGAAAFLAAATTTHAGTFLGPLNPGFENGAANWNVGEPGGSGGTTSFSNSPTNGPTSPGTNCALMTADGTVSPPNGNDMRADHFSLGAAANGRTGVTFQFDYNILNTVTFGNAVRCDLRWEDGNGNFLADDLFYVGTPNGDTGGQGWQHFSVNTTPINSAVTCDIRFSMNVFGDDIWSSGPVLFDNFSVTVNPSIGPANPGFEQGGLYWNVGQPGGSGGTTSFANSPSNGPSAPGTNCVLMTADGSVNPPNGNDLRANDFSLGFATQGNEAISIDFDYNILNPVNFGNQIRVGTRYEDQNGGFLGEYNFHLGTPNGDVGGQGWKHFHGVAVPTFSAVNMDIRISMNVFGDDVWSSGPVLFDNFVVVPTPVIGPDVNGNFESGGANWNAGGPGGSAGSVSFMNASNGWSAPGTNCALITSDESDGPTGNGVDMRVNAYSLANNSQPVTFSWDYNILNPVRSGDQIRVGLRFFSQQGGNNFNGEYNTHLGTPNGDIGGQGWKHMTVSAVVPSGSVSSDIRISMNVFGDDTWGSGPVEFDNFTVVTGTFIPPSATNLIIGTIQGKAVTRLIVGGSEPATDGSGNPLTVSYVGPATNGATSTDETNVTYTPTAGYVGSDQFTFGLSDGLGGFTTATASVDVNATAGLNKFVTSASTGTNTYSLTFSGAPYVNYILQSTSSLTPPITWTPVATNAADGSGIVTFTGPQSGNATFWRALLGP